jgi:hypothetical protein
MTVVHPRRDPDRTSALVPYLPRLVVEWLTESPDARHRELHGTVAFVDISGFTKLSERLAKQGKVGAEELSDTRCEPARQPSGCAGSYAP